LKIQFWSAADVTKQRMGTAARSGRGVEVQLAPVTDMLWIYWNLRARIQL
jgi:hypothetical protein